MAAGAIELQWVSWKDHIPLSKFLCIRVTTETHVDITATVWTDYMFIIINEETLFKSHFEP